MLIQREQYLKKLIRYRDKDIVKVITGITFPLTFEEFYNYRKLDKSDAFREYLMFGGLPFI